ncbi:MAG: Flp pilus assembly protein CpaB [Roseinatronobacter sp.]
MALLDMVAVLAGRSSDGKVKAMRLVFAAVLLSGIALAGVAAFQTYQYVTALQGELQVARRNASSVETVDVLVVGRDVRYGATLTREDVLVAPFPSFAVPAGAYTDVQALFPDNIDARVVLRAMDRLEPLLASKLTEPGKQAGITSHLSEGRRAVTIPVNQTSGVAGFLRPGDHVDIFWSGRTRDGGEVTQLLEASMRLIAVDQSADMDRVSVVANARTVTLEATPEQSAALAHAQSSGRLTLALVGVEDTTRAGNIEMNQDRLLGVVREERQVVELERCHIRTRRGLELVLMEVPCTN